MKCSSRRNCNRRGGLTVWKPLRSLNEVQLPKELQPDANADAEPTERLNEVQLPKELQHVDHADDA